MITKKRKITQSDHKETPNDSNETHKDTQDDYKETQNNYREELQRNMQQGEIHSKQLHRKMVAFWSCLHLLFKFRRNVGHFRSSYIYKKTVTGLIVIAAETVLQWNLVHVNLGQNEVQLDCVSFKFSPSLDLFSCTNILYFCA